MTNDELIKWAKLEEASDFVWHARKENLNALIWIAKQEARAEVWKQIGAQAKMEADARLLASYPGGLKKRKLKEMPTDEDYLAAMGPCGK